MDLEPSSVSPHSSVTFVITRCSHSSEPELPFHSGVTRETIAVLQILTLRERGHGESRLSRLDGEQSLSLQAEQVLLLDLMDLQELLLEGQLLRRHLLLDTRTESPDSV